MDGYMDGWIWEQKVGHFFLPSFHAAIIVHMNVFKNINNAEKKDKLQVYLGHAPKSSSGF